MAQTLNIPNYASLNILAQAQLTAAAPAATSSLSVDDTNGFASDGFALIGAKGVSDAELRALGTITTLTDLPLANATSLPHNQFAPIFALFGDKLKIYRAANPTDNSQPPDTDFAPLGDPIPMDVNSELTSYNDQTGGGNYWYKFTYFNSVTSSETDLGSATAMRGNFTPAYCSLDEVRDEAGFNNAPYINDSKIDRARQAAQSEIDGALNEFYDVPLQAPINDYLKRICIRLAAGYLRLGQYSSNQNPQVNGQAMVDDAQAQLTKLILKERELMTKAGKALDGPGAVGGIDGFPNAPGSLGGGAPRLFRMRDVQGQPLTSGHNGEPVGNLYYGRKW